jgi:hypothetical protein
LDSQYERDFDQKFMMNKLNFDQVNEEILEGIGDHQPYDKQEPSL